MYVHMRKDYIGIASYLAWSVYVRGKKIARLDDISLLQNDLSVGRYIACLI